MFLESLKAGASILICIPSRNITATAGSVGLKRFAPVRVRHSTRRSRGRDRISIPIPRSTLILSTTVRYWHQRTCGPKSLGKLKPTSLGPMKTRNSGISFTDYSANPYRLSAARPKVGWPNRNCINYYTFDPRFQAIPNTKPTRAVGKLTTHNT